MTKNEQLARGVEHSPDHLESGLRVEKRHIQASDENAAKELRAKR